MSNDNFNLGKDRFTRGLIRRKVKQLIGRAGFTEQDREDLEQDLFVRVLESLPRFNPDQGHRYSFVTTVVKGCAANILRSRQAKKRDDRQIRSLNVTVEIAGQGQIELAQIIDERPLDARLGRHRRPHIELAQLRMDLADLSATLPESWHTLLELRKTRTMTEAAREMGVPRTTLNNLMRRVRQRFEQAGLRDYL